MVNAATQIAARERGRAQLSARSARNAKSDSEPSKLRCHTRLSPAARTRLARFVGAERITEGGHGASPPQLLAEMMLDGKKTTKAQEKKRRGRFWLKEDGRGRNPLLVKSAPHEGTGGPSRDLRGAADACSARFGKEERGSCVWRKGGERGLPPPLIPGAHVALLALPRD